MVFFHSVSDIGGLYVFRQIINHTFFLKRFLFVLEFSYIPIPNLSSSYLVKAVSFCTRQVGKIYQQDQV